MIKLFKKKEKEKKVEVKGEVKEEVKEETKEIKSPSAEMAKKIQELMRK